MSKPALAAGRHMQALLEAREREATPTYVSVMEQTAHWAEGSGDTDAGRPYELHMLVNDGEETSGGLTIADRLQRINDTLAELGIAGELTQAC